MIEFGPQKRLIDGELQPSHHILSKTSAVVLLDLRPLAACTPQPDCTWLLPALNPCLMMHLDTGIAFNPSQVEWRKASGTLHTTV